jgi:hypothetical protein
VKIKAEFKSLNQEILYYTVSEIAELLGVNVVSVCRWADSGKLQISTVEDGIKRISLENLIEFSLKYNISLKFLDSTSNRYIRTIKRASNISVAK